MRGLQKLLSTEILNSLAMMRRGDVPAAQALPEVINTTIDMLMLAFAQNAKQRALYARYREILIDEVLKLSPGGKLFPETEGMTPWNFLPTAIAIVITKWFYPADNENISPGDPIGVITARNPGHPPVFGQTKPSILGQLQNRNSLRRLPRR
jgi:hypothetical protein